MKTIEVRASSPRTRPRSECPVCSSTFAEQFLVLQDRYHGVQGEFQYQRCNACKSVFQNPVVLEEDLHLCYPSDYAPYDYDPGLPEIGSGLTDERLGWRGKIRAAVVRDVWGERQGGWEGFVGRTLGSVRFLRERAFYGLVMDSCLPKKGKGGFALDVGCGAGWMLRRLELVGWNVEGVEWNQNAAEAAANKIRGKVWTGDFREIELSKGRYNLLVMNHVFEHLHDPAEVVTRIYDLLAPGGKGVIIFPSAESIDSRWFGKNWFPWEAPRHLVFPSISGLRSVFSLSNFKEIRISTRANEYFWIESKQLEGGAGRQLSFSERALHLL